ncbi:long-chain fatty acid--CoA ligase [Actinospica sp.]|uniref:long-chain-fatty-acid--CoA ligase n=1 Tax=Actinospica sp. TaxID=1872142 RepID=UPI002CBAFD40|nr:long-chain fatty acid--CoA ligase [Actinospica sp.]HWG23405.1 long-chain fatty acid--CoA ligase [Actinospica sp.]
MVFNLATTLSESALSHPGKYVCRTAERDITYAELDELAGRFAAALLAEGLERGDRVAVQLPNVPEFLVAYYGILKAGCVVVPVNPLLTEPETAYMIGHSGARKHIDDAEDVVSLCAAAKYAADVAATNPQDTAVIIYTSGTTGRPKGAELSHFQLYMSCTVASETFGAMPEDVTLAALPLFHIYGLSCSLNSVVRYGSTMSLVRKFEAGAVLDAMARHGVTISLGVPTMYHALLMADVGDRDLSAFRVASCGGAPMPKALIEGFEQKFGVTVLEGFGMSETGAAGFVNRPGARRVGSIGMPLWGVQARIAGAEGLTGPDHVGELLMKGHVVMTGYHDDPEATGQTLVDGWLHTGDLGYVDEDGFYYIVDRIKDMIIRGGFNVYPREVEEVLYRHPAIREAAVLGRPDERLGEEIVAVIVLKPDASEPAADEVIEFCRTSLAAYKCPREVRFVAQLPRNASGKVLKRELRQVA